MKLVFLIALNLLYTGCIVSIAEQPNIILMMTDDHGWSDVGFNGNADIITPHLDRVCEQGARLHYFFAAAPVCSPTRGSVLTGRHYYRYGIWGANDGQLPRQEYSIAQGLKDVGYTTGHFGKWHVGSPHPDYVGKGGGGTSTASPCLSGLAMTSTS